MISLDLKAAAVKELLEVSLVSKLRLGVKVLASRAVTSVRRAALIRFRS